MNGINNLGEWFSIGVAPNGELLIADYDNDRILRFQDSVGELLGEGQWEVRRPRAVCSIQGGTFYVLDADGTRVQKIDGDGATVVAGGNGHGSAMNQFIGGINGLFVTGAGVIYVADVGNQRVQRWTPGTTEGATVAGGNGRGHALNQFNGVDGIFVTADETVYVADSRNHRVVKWPADATTGVIVAGGYGAGNEPHKLNCPVDVTFDDTGALYVCEAIAARVTKWEPDFPLLGALQLAPLAPLAPLPSR